MKKFNVFLICITALCLLISGIGLGGCEKEETPAEVKLRADEEVGPFYALPYVDPVEGVTGYTDSVVNYYTDMQLAAEAGVPEGYDGSVVATYGVDFASATFDFTDLKISVGDLESITVKAYTGDNTRKVVMSYKEGSETGTVPVLKKQRNKWAEYTFTSECLEPEETESEDEDTETSDTEETFYYVNFTKFDTDEGYLGCFCVYFQFVGTLDDTCYIDEISYKLRSEIDTVAPEITYEGPVKFTTTAGKKFTVEGEAHDDYENRDLDTFIEWTDKAGVDENGRAIEGGPYNFTLTAVDNSGNRTTIPMVLTVGPRDTEAPVIHNILSEELTMNAGDYFNTYYIATDNEDEVEVKVNAPEGAIDYAGRINAGDWEITLTAEDLTGNITKKTIKVHAK